MALQSNAELEKNIIDSFTYYLTNEKADKIVESLKKLSRMDISLMISIVTDEIEGNSQEEKVLDEAVPVEQYEIAPLPGDIEGNLLAMGYSAEQIAYGLQRSSTLEGAMEAILNKYS